METGTAVTAGTAAMGTADTAVMDIVAINPAAAHMTAGETGDMSPNIEEGADTGRVIKRTPDRKGMMVIITVTGDAAAIIIPEMEITATGIAITGITMDGKSLQLV